MQSICFRSFNSYNCRSLRWDDIIHVAGSFPVQKGRRRLNVEAAPMHSSLSGQISRSRCLHGWKYIDASARCIIHVYYMLHQRVFNSFISCCSSFRLCIHVGLAPKGCSGSNLSRNPRPVTAPHRGQPTLFEKSIPAEEQHAQPQCILSLKAYTMPGCLALSGYRTFNGKMHNICLPLGSRLVSSLFLTFVFILCGQDILGPS